MYLGTWSDGYGRIINFRFKLAGAGSMDHGCRNAEVGELIKERGGSDDHSVPGM